VSLIRDPAAKDRFFTRSTRRVVPYVRIPHTQTSDVWRARDTQLRIRLWEIGLAVEAVLGLDFGLETLISSNMNTSTPASALRQLSQTMDVHEPGKLIFAGHSFGAATMVQFLKSTYYADRPEVATMPDPLFTPAEDSNIRRIVTAQNLTILLDMWCFPLLSSTLAPLFRLPLPVYANDVDDAPGGAALLAVESEAFYKWTEHLHIKARLLSPDPSAHRVSPSGFAGNMAGPSFYYVRDSAHLNQSDFGVLFPWLCRKVFGSQQPERALRLNLRALLQIMRTNDYPVARTWTGDLLESDIDGEFAAKTGVVRALGAKGFDDGTEDDWAILDRSGAAGVDAWCFIDVVGMGAESGASEADILARGEKEGEDASDCEADDPERQMEVQMEPEMADSVAVLAAAH
jgi:platelet-activating factor acetylhydrolase